MIGIYIISCLLLIFLQIMSGGELIAEFSYTSVKKGVDKTWIIPSWVLIIVPLVNTVVLAMIVYNIVKRIIHDK